MITAVNSDEMYEKKAVTGKKTNIFIFLSLLGGGRGAFCVTWLSYHIVMHSDRSQTTDYFVHVILSILSSQLSSTQY